MSGLCLLDADVVGITLNMFRLSSSFSFAVAFVALLWTSVDLRAEKLPLYAFQNGLGFGTVDEEVTFLKEAGYAGLSQSKETGDDLAKQIAAYENQGLSVLSVYLDASKEAVAADLVRPLASKGGLIELTVKEMTPDTKEAVRKTAEMAASLGIRVALYPHHGFGIATTSDAMEMIEKVDHPNLGMMFNLCHFLKNEHPADLEQALADAGPKLFAVSVSGADTEGKDWSTLIQPLGEGDFPMEKLLSALQKSGFNGPIALQCYGLKGDKKNNLLSSMTAWKAITLPNE